MDAPWRQGGRGRARGRGVSLNGAPSPAPGPSSVPARNAAPAGGPWSGTGRGNVSYASVGKPFHSVDMKTEVNGKHRVLVTCMDHPLLRRCYHCAFISVLAIAIQ